MSAKPALLFLSPTVPAIGGNGLAMRMGVFLEAYARDFQVTLVVVPLAGQSLSEPPPPFIQHHAHRVITLPLDQVFHPLFQLIARHRSPLARRAALRAYPRPRPLFYDPIGTRELLAGHLGEKSFELVHSGRTYMAPLAGSYLGKTRCILDMDEDDGRTLRRIARLLSDNGDNAAADDNDTDALKFDALAAEYLPRFDLSVVATDEEAAALRARYPRAAVGVIANAIRPPSAQNATSQDHQLTNGIAVDPIDFLMVGTLAYYPNTDAAKFFCRDILPRLSQAGKRPQLTILGREPPPSLLAFADRPGITVLANVPDVTPYYAATAMAVVPIRAGGGSRIKILEAFAHGRPVVSTRIGAEGLSVVDGRHLLIADTADDFAAAAQRLLADRELAGRLAAEARQLIERRYGFEVVAREIEALAHSAGGMIECAAASKTRITHHD
jgi:glycosyltransferase involved in cell wall biosynthesis